MAAPDLTPHQMAAIDTMLAELSDGSHYGLLGVAADADGTAIQKAYYALSRQWHPDRFFRKELGEYADRLEMVFVGITQAYQTLKEPTRRKAYDRELRESGRIPSSSGARRSSAAPGAQAHAPPPVTPERPVAETRPLAEGRRTPAEPAAPAREPRLPGHKPGSIRERLDARRKEAATTTATSRVRRKVEDQVREQVRSQVTKARAFFEQGQKEFQAGRVIKAASALELAVQFDPANEEYKTLLETAKRESRGARIAQLIHQGEQAESYQQAKQAIHSYREAVALEPDDGKVHYRLAKLVRREEENDREALNLLRESVLRDPDVIEYRLALGELYKELGLRLNARREFQEILKRDKGHDGAKAGLKDL